jgi:hypothetical protein
MHFILNRTFFRGLQYSHDADIDVAGYSLNESKRTVISEAPHPDAI